MNRAYTQDFQNLLRGERAFWQQAPTIKTLFYHVKAVPKGRGRAQIFRKLGKPVVTIRTPEKTADFEKHIARASEELMEDMAVIDGCRLGADIDFVTDEADQDLDNLVKSLLDGMQRIVNQNDSAFDYLAPMRYVTPFYEPLIIVRLKKKDW